MTRHIIHHAICLVLCCFGFVTQTLAGNEKDSLRNAPKLPKSEATKVYRTFPDLAAYTAQTAPPSTEQLAAALNNALNVPFGSPEFTETYIQTHFNVPVAIADSRTQGQNTLDEIERKGRYTDYLSNSDLVELPVGMKKRLGNSNVTIGVSRATFAKDYTELTIFCKIDIPQNVPTPDGKTTKSIFFGANNVRLSNSGGLIGEPKLVLLGDYQIPINGGNTMLTLKGGMDMKTGDVANLTYVTFLCAGVKEVGIQADVAFPRSLLLPLKSDFTVDDAIDNVTKVQKKVQGTFKTVVGDWNDIMANISLQPFAIKGLDRVAFQLNNAVFDFSDKRNDPSVIFPQGYGNLVPGNPALWRGVFINQVSVILPPEFKSRNSNNRVSFAAEKMLIDNWGFTGMVSGKNILPLGSASGWDMSVDNFTIDIQSNSLRGAGFEGAIALPVSKKPDATATVKSYGLGYTAIFTADNGYLMRVSTRDTVRFDLWQAKGKLLPGSYVDLTVRDNQFRPKAFLNGDLGVSVEANGKKEAEFTGVSFEALQLQTEAPYLQARYFGYRSTSKMAGFPITITQLGLSTAGNEVALVAGVQLNLMDTSSTRLSAGTNISVVGRIDYANDKFDYTFSRLEVNKIDVDGDFKAFRLKGFVEFYRQHPIMGNGFAGGLDMTLKINGKDSIRIAAKTAFGSKEDFRYWYVDALAGGFKIPLAPPLNITGFGGGAWYHMVKTTAPADPSVCPSLIGYTPDKNMGLGLRAMTTFSVDAKAAVGDLALEVIFTNSGGLAKIALHGNAVITPPADLKTKYADRLQVESKLTGQYEKLVNKVVSKGQQQYLTDLMSNVSQAAKTNKIEPQDPNEGAGSIRATLGIEMDFTNKVLDGNFDVYVDLANGMIRGSGYNSLAGYAKMRFTPSKWYIHMGTPQNPMGIYLNVAGLSMSTTSYLMVGDSLGATPPPPSVVANLLGQKAQTLDYMRNLNDLGTGRGFAFGSSFSMNASISTASLFYARFQAGVGFDIMVKDYVDTRCVGYPDPIGMKGWYANGQAYAYLQGELGIRVNLWWIKKDIPIISAGAAVLMQAKLPKPTWFTGYVSGNYNLLGGVVSGGFSCKVSMGDNCELDSNSGSASPMEFITDFLPEKNATDVDIMAVPQAVFRLPVNQSFTMTDLATGLPKTYRARLNQFTVSKNGANLLGTIKYSAGSDAAFFETNEILPPSSTLRAYVEVNFEEYRNYGWYQVYSNGQPLMETKDMTFTTGTAPDNIPLNNIALAYPVLNQKYFLPRESNQGMIRLKKGQAYLLNGTTLSIKFTDNTGAAQTAACTYDAATKDILFTIPSLSTSRTYTTELLSASASSGTGTDYTSNSLVSSSQTTDLGAGSTISMTTKKASTLAVRSVTATTAPPKTLHTFTFASSQHNTFTEKMQAKPIWWPTNTDLGNGVYALAAAVNYYSEPFDKFELRGTALTNTQPLIQPEAVLDDNYFVNYMNPAIYSWLPYESFSVPRNTANVGLIPSKAIDIISSYETTMDNDPTNGSLRMTFPYRYSVAKYYRDDYYELQPIARKTYEECANYYYGYGYYYYCSLSPYAPNHIRNLVYNGFPTMPYGNDYKTRFKYVLPNGLQTSSYNFNFQYYGY